VAHRIRSSNPSTKVIKEELFQTPGGTVKPDLVIIDVGRVHVADVTVRHEDIGYLQGGHLEKVTKYSPLLQQLAEQFTVTPGRVLPIIIRPRGALPKSTISSITDLSIFNKDLIITISLISLRSSIQIYNSFLDYDALIA
jgi:hypothetical protein